MGDPEGRSGRGQRGAARAFGRGTDRQQPGRPTVLAVLLAVGWDLVALVTAARAGWPPAADARWAAAALAMSAWFWVAFGLTVRSLRRLRADRAEESARLMAAATAQAADSARRTAGAAYFQALHDTVVTTLVVIARGGLGHRAAEVRQRCARAAARR